MKEKNSTKPGRKDLSSHSPIKTRNVQCENVKNGHILQIPLDPNIDPSDVAA